MTDEIDFCEQWRSEGWALVPDMVPLAEIDAAVAEIKQMDIPLAGGPVRRADVAAAGGGSSRRGVEPTFKGSQFDGTNLFPLPGATRLNRLFTHPAIVSFARKAMQQNDLRLYQSRLWSKHGDHTDYEQPLHRDQNHSIVATRSDPGFWHMECFLYLSDVDEGNGAPCLVPRSASFGEPSARGSVSTDEHPELYANEQRASGRRGSLLAYRSDVWHRGTGIASGLERHVGVLAFRPADAPWIGFDSHAPFVSNDDFVTYVEGSTPDELGLFGFPPPGHRYWTPTTLADTSAIYPKLDLTPWVEGLTS